MGIVLCGAGCSIGSGGTVESTSELVAAIASGASAGADLGWHPLRWLTPTAFAASTACGFYSPGSATCNDGIVTLAMSRCSFTGTSAIWNGTQVLTFGTPADCNVAALPFVVASHTLSRRILAGTTRTTPSGLVVTLDTQTAAGYSSPVSGGYVITVSADGLTQSMAINGITISSYKWNETFNTTTPLTIAIADGSRTITSGTIRVQNNLSRLIATSTFNTVGFVSTSCFPQTGSITTTYANQPGLTETLTFTGAQSASLATSTLNGITTVGIGLSHCF